MEVVAISTEGKRTLITAVRRVVFAGLILLGAWLVLAGLRALPASLIDLQDWANSWVTGKPIAEMMAGRLGYTAQLVVLGGLLGLAIAAVFLFLGVLISWVTDRPARSTAITDLVKPDMLIEIECIAYKP